jgi:hypothetical protein
MIKHVPFDKVIVSCDDSPMFLDFWPIVCSAWFKFFPDVEVDLAFVTKRSNEDPVVQEMREFGDVTVYPMIDDIPASNQGKIARAYHASQHKDRGDQEQQRPSEVRSDLADEVQSQRLPLAS